MENISVSLIDADFARRARIAFVLGGCDVHVEPFEDVREFSAHAAGRKVVMVHDQDQALLEVLRWASATNSTIGVIGYSEDPQLQSVVDGLKAGAFDYIAWPAEPQLIKQKIAACSQERRAEWEKAERMQTARKLLENLTPRESQVLEEMARGHSSRIIGGRLGISSRTVEIHRAHMLSKINASNSPDAVRIAFEAGLILD